MMMISFEENMLPDNDENDRIILLVCVAFATIIFAISMILRAKYL
jgi:hypothetical protein